MPTLETPNSGGDTTHPQTALNENDANPGEARNTQIHDLERDSEPEPDQDTPEGTASARSSMTSYLEQMFAKKFDAIQSMVERLPGVAPPIRKSGPDSYADTPFADEIVLIEMPRKFSFHSIKMYDGTGDPDDHIAQYKQRMLAVSLPRESREATMCKGFGSTLIGPALQWYISLPTRSISSFTTLSDQFIEHFASSRNVEKTLDCLYEIHQRRTETLRSYIARYRPSREATPRGGPLQRADEIPVQDDGRCPVPSLG
ncbi:hypothetical protein Bca101_057627 [Brassica carinata]